MNTVSYTHLDVYKRQFVGRPLVEGTKTLSNFTIVASNLGTNLYGAYVESVKMLAEQLLEQGEKKADGGRELLVLHASSHKSSNTYACLLYTSRCV